LVMMHLNSPEWPLTSLFQVPFQRPCRTSLGAGLFEASSQSLSKVEQPERRAIAKSQGEAAENLMEKECAEPGWNRQSTSENGPRIIPRHGGADQTDLGQGSSLEHRPLRGDRDRRRDHQLELPRGGPGGGLRPPDRRRRDSPPRHRPK